MVMAHDQDDREADETDARPRLAQKSPTTLRGWKKWLATVLALFFLVGVLASIASDYMEVRAGRGGELHRSMWGFKVSPIGILVTTGASFVVLPAYWVIEWLLHRRDMALGRKHRKKPT